MNDKVVLMIVFFWLLTCSVIAITKFADPISINLVSESVISAKTDSIVSTKVLVKSEIENK